MKRLLLAIALTSAAAIAQPEPEVTPAPAPDTTVTTETTAPDPAMTTTPAPAPMTATPSTGSVQAPGNTNPETDARGIAVISDAAIVPAGYNGTPATGVGGPVSDPATGEAANTTDTAHPPCSRTVTDNCVQTYERGRGPQ
jgi:hypothetical protein